MINVIVQFAKVIYCDKRHETRLLIQNYRNHSYPYAARTVINNFILIPIGTKGIVVGQHYLPVVTPV